MGFLKQLFCTHYWDNDNNFPKSIYDYDIEFITHSKFYSCKKCGKRKLFKHKPINFIEGE